MALKQQTYADDLNDYIGDKTRELQYAQSLTQLQAQKISNDLAVSNAVFDASVQRAQADIQQTAGNTQAQRQLSEADLAAENQTTETIQGITGETSQLVNSLLESLSNSGNQENTIANLLDQMAAGGGINEALSLLLGDGSQETQASANLARQQQKGDIQVTDAKGLESASRNLNQADFNTQTGLNALAAEQQRFNADRQRQDALGSQQVVNAGFAATRAANEANYRIGVLSDQANRYSRNYIRQANEQGLLQGAQLQQDVLKAQAAQVKTPGFLDYVGVGLGAYNTYRQLQ